MEEIQKRIIEKRRLQNKKLNVINEFKSVIKTFEFYRQQVEEQKDDKYFTTYFKCYVFYYKFISNYLLDHSLPYTSYCANKKYWANVYKKYYDINYLFFRSNINRYVLFTQSKRGSLYDFK